MKLKKLNHYIFLMSTIGIIFFSGKTYAAMECELCKQLMIEGDKIFDANPNITNDEYVNLLEKRCTELPDPYIAQCQIMVGNYGYITYQSQLSGAYSPDEICMSIALCEDSGGSTSTQYTCNCGPNAKSIWANLPTCTSSSTDNCIVSKNANGIVVRTKNATPYESACTFCGCVINSDNEWTYSENRIVKRPAPTFSNMGSTTCQFTEGYEYACADGSYYTGGTDSTIQCAECPWLCDKTNDVCMPGNTTIGNRDPITACYLLKAQLEQLTLADNSGDYVITDTCYYTK